MPRKTESSNASYQCFGGGSGALESVRLLGLSCDWRLQQLALREREARQAPHLSQLACSFAPVLVTPDELDTLLARPGTALAIFNRGRVQRLDELHAGEHVGVAHVVDLLAVFQLDDEADRLAAHMHFVGIAGRVAPDVG